MTADPTFDIETPHVLVEGNLRSLTQLKSALEALSDQCYTRQPDDGGSPLGGHVRHIIEFYQEFLKLAEGDGEALSYDRRQRNLEIETSRSTALAAVQDIEGRLATVDVSDKNLALSMTVDPQAPMITMKTTLERELFHVLDHCIHHMAMLKMVAGKIDVSFDENFGVANSTQCHRQKT